MVRIFFLLVALLIIHLANHTVSAENSSKVEYRYNSIRSHLVSSKRKVGNHLVYCYFQSNKVRSGIITLKAKTKYWTELSTWIKSKKLSSKRKNSLKRQAATAKQTCKKLYVLSIAPSPIPPPTTTPMPTTTSTPTRTPTTTSTPTRTHTRTATPTSAPTRASTPTSSPTPNRTSTPSATPTPSVISPECAGEDPHSDALFLLKESEGLSVSIFNKGDGSPSFTVTLGNRILRRSSPNEKFYVLEKSGLNVQYSISRRCGGVDVNYRIENPPTNQAPLTIADMLVEGLTVDFTAPIKRLRTKDLGNLTPLDLANPSWKDQNTSAWEDGSYPQVYSPALVVTDDVYAIGSALFFPVLEYRQTILPTLQLNTSAGDLSGTFQQRYAWPRVEGYPVNQNLAPKQLAPGEVRTYTLALRFSRARNWLATLAPYKQYFNSLYSAGRLAPFSDRLPIRAVVMADPIFFSSSNPRAYDPTSRYRLLQDGWNTFVPTFAQESKNLGYERAMLWLPSGRYSGGLNFPPQFMDFDTLMQNTSDALRQFQSYGLRLGLWWGHSTSIPVFSSQDTTWNPINLVNADLDKPDHISFLTTQLSKALSFGTTDFGLDYFVSMPLYQRYEWSRQLRLLAPSAVFAGEGQQADVIHSRIDNYHNAERGGHLELPEVPDVLSTYLNPGMGTWLEIKRESLEKPIARSDVQQFVSWGYTPLLLYYHGAVDVHALDLTIVQCNDGLDNDGDGFTDFPFDQGCQSDQDTLER